MFRYSLKGKATASWWTEPELDGFRNPNSGSEAYRAAALAVYSLNEQVVQGLEEGCF